VGGGSRRGSTRSILSISLLGIGVLLLLLVPGILLALAFARTEDAELPGTLVIISAVGGMAFVVAGVALRE
jgi:hypothetical protein